MYQIKDIEITKDEDEETIYEKYVVFTKIPSKEELDNLPTYASHKFSLREKFAALTN